MGDKDNVIKSFWDNDSKKISDSLLYFSENEKPLEFHYYGKKLTDMIIKREHPQKINSYLNNIYEAFNSITSNNEIDDEIYNIINSKIDLLIQDQNKKWALLQENYEKTLNLIKNIESKLGIKPKKTESILKTRKIQLYPTNEQKIILQKWFDGARCTYNDTVAYINEKSKSQENISKLLNMTELEKKFVIKTSYFCEKCNKFIKKMLICDECNSKTTLIVNENLKKELEEIPSHIRSFSCRSAITAFKSSFTNLKNGNISKFDIGYKKRKKLIHDSIDITYRDCPIIRDTGNNSYGFKIYPDKLGFISIVKKGKNIRNKTLKRFPDIVKHDYKITYDYRTKKYVACISTDQYIPKPKNPSITLSGDPGVRTFLTLYDSSNGDCIKISNRNDLIMKLEDKINTMKSISDILKIKRFKKKSFKYYNRINNLISDFHWRAADYISKYQDCSTILLPHFESQKMIKKDANDFNSILIYYNRHYQFAQKLTWKCMKVGIIVKRVNECYTSKTCGICGTINDKLGNSKIFNCVDNNCINKNIERDYHAARNIFIKNYNLTI